jgi:peptidoglycan/xylan/chitin deacetylase (PgdA/CDA1 family)
MLGMRRPRGTVVFMYHWVDASLGDRLRLYGVTPEAFAAQMAALARAGRTCLTLEALQGHLAAGDEPPPGSFVLTFDDAYQDLETTVAPLLERHAFNGTVFVVTDRAGGANAWDLPHGDPPRKLLGYDSMRRMDGKTFRFQAHSCTHPMLPRIPAEQARREIADSKRRLEDELGREVPAFSYPHGEYSPREEAMVREAGYLCAVTDDRGVNRAGVAPLRIRRVMVTSEDGPLGFAFKARTGHDLRTAARHLLGAPRNPGYGLHPDPRA